MSQATLESVRNIAHAAAKDNPWFELAEWVCGNCMGVSIWFVLHLKHVHGIDGASLIRLEDVHKPFSNPCSSWRDLRSLGHIGVTYKDTFICFTYRQFDTTCDIPFICPMNDLLFTWKSVTYIDGLGIPAHEELEWLARYDEINQKQNTWYYQLYGDW